jgi:hypothetical protein
VAVVAMLRSVVQNHSPHRREAGGGSQTALTENHRLGRQGARTWRCTAAEVLAVDPQRYRTLLTAIKEGYAWEEGLKFAYGWTPDELVRRYGASIGIPNLQPRLQAATAKQPNQCRCLPGLRPVCFCGMVGAIESPASWLWFFLWSQPLLLGTGTLFDGAFGRGSLSCRMKSTAA